MSPVFLPALGALLVLFLDALAGPRAPGGQATRDSALSGIRLGIIAVSSVAAVLLFLPGRLASGRAPGFALDAFAAVGITLLVAIAFLVLALSLTHFGMARSRPGEPIALLLLSLSGLLATLASESLLVLILALELAWLPAVALVAIDSRRLSSSESSLKLFFAHALASLMTALGVTFVFGGVGQLELAALAGAASASAATPQPLFFELGVALLLVGLVARCAVAPFHPWSPDLHEGAPTFVTAHMATLAPAASFLVLVRVLHALVPADPATTSALVARLPDGFGALGCLTLLWGHAMALVQVSLRRLVGWLGVGQAGFMTLALVDVRGGGAEALLAALLAASVATIGVLATIASLSHHERACEHVGDLAGMASESPARATLFSLFLLSLAGFPGTFGFVARRDVLTTVERAGERGFLLVGVVATVLALTAVGRPLGAVLRPAEGRRATSRALSNEQVVLGVCGVFLLYMGTAPLFGERALSGGLERWIAAGVASLPR